MIELMNLYDFSGSNDSATPSDKSTAEELNPSDPNPIQALEISKLLDRITPSPSCNHCYDNNRYNLFLNLLDKNRCIENRAPSPSASQSLSLASATSSSLKIGSTTPHLPLNLLQQHQQQHEDEADGEGEEENERVKTPTNHYQLLNQSLFPVQFYQSMTPTMIFLLTLFIISLSNIHDVAAAKVTDSQNGVTSSSPSSSSSTFFHLLHGYNAAGPGSLLQAGTTTQEQKSVDCPSGCQPAGSINDSTFHSDGGVILAYLLASLCCIVVGGIMSGLQVGLFSLDPMKLELIKNDPNSTVRNRTRAEKLQPILSQHHWLLVTLLVCNAAAMEALPIFLDAIVPSYVAIILSVTFVLFFGEIIPQALCTKSPLSIGAFFAPFIRVLMWFVAPISWPLSKLLDYILGEHGRHYLLKRSELDTLLVLHDKEHGGLLNTDQVNLMKGALSIHENTVSSVMTPLREVYMLDVHRKLDFETLHEIFTSGYSRIPCYDANRPAHDNIVGLLIVKDLILLDPNDATPISTILNLYPRSLECMFPDCTLNECMNIFKTGRTHMALVQEVIDSNDTKDPYYNKIGIVTLEDIIEAVLQTEIDDEVDLTRASTQGTGSGDGDDDTYNDDLNTEHMSGRAAVAKKFDRRRHLPNMLSPQEASAVFYHLIGTCPPFKPDKCLLSDTALKKLIGNTAVIEIKANDRSKIFGLTSEQSAEYDQFFNLSVNQGGRLLYKRGEPSEYFTLLLDGRCEIKAGVEEFTIENGRWTTLGAPGIQMLADDLDTILNADSIDEISGLSEYVPDFTAVCTTHSRILRISKQRYIAAIRAERLPQCLTEGESETLDEVYTDTLSASGQYAKHLVSIQGGYKRYFSQPSTAQAQRQRRSRSLEHKLNVIQAAENRAASLTRAEQSSDSQTPPSYESLRRARSKSVSSSPNQSTGSSSDFRGTTVHSLPCVSSSPSTPHQHSSTHPSPSPSSVEMSTYGHTHPLTLPSQSVQFTLQSSAVSPQTSMSGNVSMTDQSHSLPTEHHRASSVSRTRENHHYTSIDIHDKGDEEEFYNVSKSGSSSSSSPHHATRTRAGAGAGVSHNLHRDPELCCNENGGHNNFADT